MPDPRTSSPRVKQPEGDWPRCILTGLAWWVRFFDRITGGHTMADKDKPTQVMKGTTRALLAGSWCFVLAGCVGRNDQVADSAAGPLVADSAAGLVSVDTMTGEVAFRDV